MALKYQTGEDVMIGDRVRYGGDEGTVEFVVQPDTAEPNLVWYAQEFGQGAMLKTAKLGSVFTDPEEDVDLELVSRK